MRLDLDGELKNEEEKNGKDNNVKWSTIIVPCCPQNGNQLQHSRQWQESVFILQIEKITFSLIPQMEIHM